MNCEQTERVSLLIDGELPEAETRQVELHLLECRECQEARASFLQMRSQITAYSPQLEPAAPRASLAKILARPTAKPVRIDTRNAFPGFVSIFNARGFNAPLAAFAALLVVAFTIGIFAVLRSRPAPEIANDQTAQTGSTSKTASGSDSSNRPDPSTDVNPRRGRKPLNASPRGTAPNVRKPNSKPNRERSAPPPAIPQPRNLAPLTYAGITEPTLPGVTATRAVDTESQTMRHLEQAEVLLRTFRNLRLPASGLVADVNYERRRARQLVNQNIMLRREADTSGDVQVSTLLTNLEPILLDIANLREKPRTEELVAIQDRVERKSLVALLQINSSALARAND